MKLAARFEFPRGKRRLLRLRALGAQPEVGLLSEGGYKDSLGLSNLGSEEIRGVVGTEDDMHAGGTGVSPVPIWSDERLQSSGSAGGTVSDDYDTSGWRSRFQQDYDRLLFSTPVRRLSDKTQVWPMDENDGVRTRLTHSHEVANLARSIGSGVAERDQQVFAGADIWRIVQPILSAIGLVHDLGNPPFGHQGEVAIGNWFQQRSAWIFSRESEGGQELLRPVPESLHSEFTSFDGNPQSLRLVTKLQTSIGKIGLGLTAATIAALLKYPVGAAGQKSGDPLRKKAGYFESEKAVVEWARSRTGLGEGQRHPLTWIMEASDDIAYSVLDVEDAMKKGIISPDDVLTALLATPELADTQTSNRIKAKFDETERSDRRPPIQRDIKIGYLRAFLIDDLIGHAVRDFLQNKATIFELTHETPLMDGSNLCGRLKDLAGEHAFSHPSVLRTEALGAKAIDQLMTFFWDAIALRKKPDDMASRRTTAMAKYGFSLISPNYIEQVVDAADGTGEASGMRYRELRLLTDTISGMTDTYAVRVWNDIKELIHGHGA